MTKFPRGSEWRKWDYHVHTPASWYYKDRSADAFKKIADAINASECQAFGINDYLTIDGYLKLQPLVKKTIFPVVEFRMTDMLVEKKQNGPHFNFHLFFTNNPKHLDDIQAFLTALQFDDYKGVKKNLTPAEIVAFGKQITPGETDEGKLRAAALEKIKFPFAHVMDVLKDKGLRDRCLVIIPYDEHGGIDGIDPKDDGLQKSGLIRQADMIGSSSSKVREYFLGQADRYTPEEFELWVGRRKPIIKGSDAHAPEGVGHLPKKADGIELHCWVKADLTFEGLKQTVYEPEERIFIGSTPPDNKDSSKVIDSISIRSANGWFEDQKVALNRDLVAIIGGKGSGKTALVDLIGLAGGDFDASNLGAFLNKANRELEGTKLLLNWEDGNTETELEITSPLEIPIDRKVRYLSQSFVESLCSFDRHRQLESEIEGILFQYIPGTEALGAENFEALKAKRTEGIQLEVSDIEIKIRELNEEIEALIALIGSRDHLVRERDQFEKDINELNKQKPQPSNEEERKVADDLRKLKEQRAKIVAMVEQIRIKQTKLELLSRKIGLISESVRAFNTEARATLQEVGELDILAQLEVALPQSASSTISQRIQKRADEAAALEGSAQSPQGTETIASLDQKINILNQKSTAEVQKKSKLEEFDRRIAEAIQKRDALAQKISNIEQFSRKELDAKNEQRKQLFLSFFVKLEEKRRVLEKLYEPLNAKAALTEEGAKIQFYARYTFNKEKFGADAGDIFDQRKSVIRGDQSFVSLGDSFWQGLVKGVPNPDFGVVEKLINDLQTPRGAEPRPLSEQIKTSKTPKDIANWLYSLDYYDVEYGIKYEGTDLDKLSPGKKGVVLLLIYLTIDKDYRPLIIDQPEENLDNRSVYSTLVEYFRKAKKNRQVIIVTHNANLVVNGDAEQVIVANFEKDITTQSARIRYVSGSLEHSVPYTASENNVLDRQGIREHVCELLEGGEKAFEKREEKYGFPKPATA